MRNKADVSRWNHTRVQQFREEETIIYLAFVLVYFNPSITDGLLIKTMKLVQREHCIAEARFETTIIPRRTLLHDHKGKVRTKKT